RGQPEMAVGDGRAVPGEVFGARGHSGRLQTGDRGRGVRGDQRGIDPKRPGADDRVVVGGVDVDRGGEVEADAELGQLVADGPIDLLGEGEVVDRAERRVARVRAAGG